MTREGQEANKSGFFSAAFCQTQARTLLWPLFSTLLLGVTFTGLASGSELARVGFQKTPRKGCDDALVLAARMQHAPVAHEACGFQAR